ncbi:MAG: hypothetical protein R2809_13060 [Flavobacteriales bacterium]
MKPQALSPPSAKHAKFRKSAASYELFNFTLHKLIMEKKVLLLTVWFVQVSALCGQVIPDSMKWHDHLSLKILKTVRLVQ